jgi:DNA-binding CsgD family transcriptional regulator
MEPEIARLMREYDEVFTSQNFIEKDLDYSVMDRHLEILNQLNVIEQSSISIFDLYTREHVYLSSGFESVLGYDLAEAYREGNDFFARMVHPDDFIMSVKTGTYFFKLVLQLTPEQRKHYKLINDYRIRGREGNYIRVIEQFQALEFDRHGNIWLALCVLDVSPDQDTGRPMRSKMLNFKTGELFSLPSAPSEGKLARRERQVLELISEGLISKEIADRLYISVHTVNTHRQRILEKLKAKNIHEAIKLAKEIGLV